MRDDEKSLGSDAWITVNILKSIVSTSDDVNGAKFSRPLSDFCGGRILKMSWQIASKLEQEKMAHAISPRSWKLEREWIGETTSIIVREKKNDPTSPWLIYSSFHSNRKKREGEKEAFRHFLQRAGISVCYLIQLYLWVNQTNGKTRLIDYFFPRDRELQKNCRFDGSADMWATNNYGHR